MAKKRDERHPYLKLAAEIRAQIMAGNLTPGTQLPSTRQLMEQYSVPNATVQNAVALLKEEGFLLGQAGKGVFVRERQNFVVDVAAYFAPSPRGYSYRMLDVRAVEPPSDVAQALGEDRAILRHRLTLHDGDPVELTWSYYPASIAAGTPLAERGKILGGAPQALADLGYPQREFTDRVSTRPPTTEEAEGLEIPEGISVIRQFRTITSDDARPVEVSIIIKAGHVYELKYRQAVVDGA
ncbi:MULTISPECIES: GntR family transcriptional regulator [unclassified Nonomuraea]|uniref:GntR family transcriptional regulator n=1 Tax=unclassified Nonomuraea TaxID=2593643 RepID=UPI0033F48716